MKKIVVLTFLFILQLAFNPGNSFGQWVQSSSGLPPSASCYTFAANGNNIFAGLASSAGVYLTTNNGSNWTQTALNNKSVNSLAVKGSNIFAGTLDSGLFISTNNGSSWTKTSLSISNVKSLSVNGNDIFAGSGSSGGSGGVYKSSNNGSNWAQTSLINSAIYSLATSGDNIFAGTLTSGVYLSTNRGSNWTQTSLNTGTVYSLSMSGNNIFAGTLLSGVYLSTNNGSSWTQTSLNTGNVFSLASNGNFVFAGTSGGSGVYFTSDNGTSWVQKNQGLTTISTIGALLVDNNIIFAGNWGQGVWKRSLSEIIGIKNISTEVPSEFSLKQNYPNPFNPNTNIKFSILNSGLVRLTVFDIMGREVQTLVNESLSPGTYESTFDAAQFASGIYYYKLSTPLYSETKKMILQK